MKNQLIVWLAVLVMGSASSSLAQSAGTNERLATPRSAIDNFLKWQIPPTVDLDIASEAFTVDSSLSAPERLGKELSADELGAAVEAFGPGGRLARPHGPELKVGGRALGFQAGASPTRGSE